MIVEYGIIKVEIAYFFFLQCMQLHHLFVVATRTIRVFPCGKFLELHDIAGQGARFVGEYVLNLPQFLV